jgi:hypothetical protein
VHTAQHRTETGGEGAGQLCRYNPQEPIQQAVAGRTGTRQCGAGLVTLSTSPLQPVVPNQRTSGEEKISLARQREGNIESRNSSTPGCPRHWTCVGTMRDGRGTWPFPISHMESSIFQSQRFVGGKLGLAASGRYRGALSTSGPIMLHMRNHIPTSIPSLGLTCLVGVDATK